MSFASRLLKKVGGQRDHDPNTAPQSAYYPPPPVSPYQQLAPAQFAPPLPPHIPPPPTALAHTVPSPPPLPSRQRSSPQHSTFVVHHASQFLQPYDAPAQQGWLANGPPVSISRQPSPQQRPISPCQQPIATPQSSAEAQFMGEPSRQRSRGREPPQLRKILSLDGGGVRGLSIITILKYIMKNVNRERGIDLEPWEEFDMIGGTSTGG